MKSKLLILVFLGILLLTACSNAKESVEPMDAYPIVIETEESEIGYPIEVEVESPTDAYPISEAYPVTGLEDDAAQVIQALAVKDMERVAEFVHPVMGVRFSPYAFVHEDHQVFMPDELPGLIGSGEVYVWGAYDGSGASIELTFDAYFDQFVYSSDFANPEQIGMNERISQGNSINNIAAFYPGSFFVEYHFSGFDAQYEGMDWQSLRLVFLQEGDAWYLAGIVHDQWTG